MPKLTLGIPENYKILNLEELIYHDFNFVPAKVSVQDGKINMNCDTIYINNSYMYGKLMRNSIMDLNDALALHIPKIGYRKLSKLEQHLFFTLKNINCPEYYYSDSDSPFSLYALMNKLDDNDELIIKYQYGANGERQFLLKKNQIIDFQRLCYEYKESLSKKNTSKIKEHDQIDPEDKVHSSYDEIMEFSNKHNILFGGHPSKIYESFEFALRDINDWVITKKIKIKREFRIIWFNYCNSYIYVERKINKNHFQNNLAITNDISNTIYYGTEYPPDLDPKYKDIIKDWIIMGFNKYYPEMFTIALDVYIDENDDLGIFEFSNEYGVLSLDKNKIRELAVESIESNLQSRYNISKYPRKY